MYEVRDILHSCIKWLAYQIPRNYYKCYAFIYFCTVSHFHSFGSGHACAEVMLVHPHCNISCSENCEYNLDFEERNIITVNFLF